MRSEQPRPRPARNPRERENPLLGWLERLNARYPWDHNAHFHPWILRQLPPGADRVLDVGCGRGVLAAALATRAARVDGIDPDPAMAYAAATALRERRGVQILRRTLAEHASRPEHTGSYDAVILLASLHHLELETALQHSRDLLRPGGRLLVVTLTRPEGIIDRLWEAKNVLTNPLRGMLIHQRSGQVRAERPAGMPVQEPAFTLAALRETAAAVLGPGARIRRREGFRATLRWQMPAELSPGADAGR